jgi:putative endonuclease
VKHLQLGRLGEKVAADYLIKNGYKILSYNYRTSLGEIDLVAEYQKQLIFIEVKARSSLNYGEPYESVTVSKQKKLRMMALLYLQECNPRLPCRFDVLSLLFDSQGEKLLNLEHLKNAF